MLKAGDIVVTHSPCVLSSLISWAEKRDPVSDSRYSHSFIVISDAGAILDTLIRVSYGRIDNYRGSQVLIGRWVGQLQHSRETAIWEITKDLGQRYPIWRLVADFLYVGRLCHFREKICSERVTRFLSLLTGRPIFADCWGWTPAELAVVIEEWRNFQIIYEGEWK
jgi:hypothetical protein